LSDQDLDKALSGSSAHEFVERFRAGDFKEIGERRIHGVNASGIETVDREFWGGVFDEGRLRLWVDTETQWPVRLEYEGKADDGAVWVKYVMDDFAWNPALSREDFAFEIPSDYASLGVVEQTEINEDTAIEGLRQYGRIMQGRYPRKLVMASAMKELEDDEKRLRQSGLLDDHDVADLLRIQKSCQFFNDLQEADRDPAYYGDTVSRGDFDRVLLRWRLDSGDYRVVYGDLRAQTVDAVRLAELESN
jgi:hypothetical protein